MRRTLRKLASVKPARYLEPGTPTGLTVLFTHSTPRSTLLYLYTTTLDKLKAIPEHSVYRQSVEALTKHRMAIVEAEKPQGYDAWVEKARKVIADNPEQFNVAASGRVDGGTAWRVERGGSVFLIQHIPEEVDMRDQEWDGEVNEGPELEGSRRTEERKDQILQQTRKPMEAIKRVELEDEPLLTADQYVDCTKGRLYWRSGANTHYRIAELETKIGAGLIEEVIQVAESEVKLIDIMAKAKV